MNNKGVSVGYRELVQMTLKSVLKLVEVKHDFEHLTGDTLTIFFKDGCDGAGQQVVMQSTSMIDAKDNMFLYGLVVLKLVCKRENGEEIVLWQNKTLNSSGTLRPIYLLREQETRCRITESCYSEYRSCPKRPLRKRFVYKCEHHRFDEGLETEEENQWFRC